jgi:hypothetical protein
LLGLLLLALAASFFMWWWRVDSPLPASEPGPSADDASPAGAPAPPAPERVAERPPAPAPSPAAHCLPRTSRDCKDGDVWWFDSCGEANERAEVCAEGGCEAGRCVDAQAATDRCGTVSAWGQCEGDVAQACVMNRVVRVDCAAQHQRCAMTSEGAACLPRDDKNGCYGSEPPSCSGDRLRLCVDGRWRELNCKLRRATCSSEGGIAHCESDRELSLALAKLEICDGQDNDQDQKIDEGASCDTVPLVAFVPSSAKLNDLDGRMKRDLEIMNEIFAPIRFRWAKTVNADAHYREFDPNEMTAAAQLFSQAEAKPREPNAEKLDFYIPVLFSERLTLQPPKGAISTLPNSTCGGTRVSDAPSPPSGLIALADARMPETLAHEMGHYLGLCHTHEELARYAVERPGAPPCKLNGDGICDTPSDPGPNQCAAQGMCDLYCARSGARPDAQNVMSYYLGCRRKLSPEQLAEVSRGLQLRRGWFRCLDPAACSCDPAQSACPADMSCHPGDSAATAWSCELDGPALPGAPCRDSSSCGQGAICLMPKSSAAGRCARACRADSTCNCVDVGLPVRICAEDLG